MDHLVCLNTNSFPAECAEKAYELFNDALQGLLSLNSGNDRYTLYLDTHQEHLLADFSLADGFSYSDFMQRLEAEQEMDMYLFLTELEDKTPALDYLGDELFNDVASYSFYMPSYSYPPLKYPDVLGIAYFLSATLLSINTSDQWNAERLSIARFGSDGRFIDEKLTINHIACHEHGKVLFGYFNTIDITNVCDACVLTSDFINWYEQQTQENKYRIIEKYRLACERKFAGGGPLFKQLKNENGLKEIRFSAYPGGAIRILFKSLEAEKQAIKQAILTGFIKKEDKEGYNINVPKAHALFNELVRLQLNGGMARP